MDLWNPVVNFKTHFNYIKNSKSNQNNIFSRLDLSCRTSLKIKTTSIELFLIKNIKILVINWWLKFCHSIPFSLSFFFFFSVDFLPLLWTSRNETKEKWTYKLNCKRRKEERLNMRKVKIEGWNYTFLHQWNN